MSVVGLLAQLKVIRARLSALRAEPTARTADLSLLRRQAARLESRFLGAAPSSANEVAAQLAGLLLLIREEADRYAPASTLTDKIDAASRAANGLLAGTRPEPRPTPRPGSEAVFGGSLAEYVTFAQARVALVSTDHRVLAISDPGARLFSRSQVEVMGLHVSELIGRPRYAQRLQPRLAACLDGMGQHFHEVELRDGKAGLVRTDMSPVSGTDGRISAILVHQHVTAAAAASTVPVTGLPRLPRQSMPGKT